MTDREIEVLIRQSEERQEAWVSAELEPMRHKIRIIEMDLNSHQRKHRNSLWRRIKKSFSRKPKNTNELMKKTRRNMKKLMRDTQ